MEDERTIAKVRLEANRGEGWFIKVDFTLNLPVRCSGSLGFDPC